MRILLAFILLFTLSCAHIQQSEETQYPEKRNIQIGLLKIRNNTVFCSRVSPPTARLWSKWSCYDLYKRKLLRLSSTDQKAISLLILHGPPREE